MLKTIIADQNILKAKLLYRFQKISGTKSFFYVVNFRIFGGVHTPNTPHADTG